MLVPTIIMGVIAIALLIIAYQRGGGEHILGLKSAGNILIQIIPLLIFAFIVAGMIQVLIPQEMISRWVGVESGFRGLLIGTVMGGMPRVVRMLACRWPRDCCVLGRVSGPW